ncbi:MAG TPA: hypothetical protein VH370_06905 [Humisphaera sp.]|jgi:hypothetical protein|nr:hypothetical protein [Humisphaera sp.]
MSDEAAQPVLALVRDLMFVSRIGAEARALGLEIRIVREPTKLAGEAGRLLLVDLNLDGAIEAASSWQQSTHGQTIGFVSHVDADTARRAREAGIGRILARSRFVELLPTLLTAPAIDESSEHA